VIHPILQPQTLSLTRDLVIGSSTREGGVSEGSYESLNLSLNTSDRLEHVRENRRRWFAALGIAEAGLGIPNQVHSGTVKVISEPGQVPECDALVTREPGLFLSVLTADCTPVLIWSKKARAVAAVHAGWRGTASGILARTLTTMQAELDCVPQDLQVYIGPGLGVDNFEVGSEFRDIFASTYLHQAHGSLRFDNTAALVAQAVKAGVSLDHIESSSHCTFADSDLFFSHRRDRGITGRMMSVIGFHEFS